MSPPGFPAESPKCGRRPRAGEGSRASWGLTPCSKDPGGALGSTEVGGQPARNILRLLPRPRPPSDCEDLGEA